jgi:starch phosphorylase
MVMYFTFFHAGPVFNPREIFMVGKRAFSQPRSSREAESPWHIYFKGMAMEDIQRGFLNNLEYSIAKDEYTFTPHDQYLSLAYTVRERLIERWIITQQQYHNQNVKRIYYLSFEFLLGRLLADTVLNLGLRDQCAKAMETLGLDYEFIRDQEPDAGLGNGGLGRLAACFLDSMATQELPAIGYGIRYEFGIFKQQIINGHQHEVPEEWLRFGNPWEIERPEYRLDIKYYGKVNHTGSNLRMASEWVDAEVVLAIPFDTPIAGFGNNTVNTLRLWSARSAAEFKFDFFSSGDYVGACYNKLTSENISKVLYPNDNNYSGRELRLKQQHFFTSASLKDIIRRYQRHNETFDDFPNKVAIQLNDTHPAIAIVELLRRLVDKHGVPWEKAWNIVRRTFAYTNHTLMPEALEKWPVSLLSKLLPRHMEVIFELNKDLMDEVSRRWPGDFERMRHMSIIEEGPEQQVRMAHLAIFGSHAVNGVAELHTNLLKNGLMRDFYELYPEKFNNKTNGITPRRWLYKANPSLSDLITKTIGDGWVRELSQLTKLIPHADDPGFQKKWQQIKHENKLRCVEKLKAWEGLEVNPDFVFDVQVKRIHEYKRQLLNALHCIHLHNEIRAGRASGFLPRTFIIGGKAAPGYFMAKLVIKFINSVSKAINNDPATAGLLRVYFVPNYRVSLAEYLIPAADISEQISTAGTEASGTGNMKFGLNGALTVGTMDGANIEMREEVGPDNIFIFGLTAEQVREKRSHGYNPGSHYNQSPALRAVIDLVRSGRFNDGEGDIFRPILGSLLEGGDPYMIMADFDSYVECHKRVAQLYHDQRAWTKMAILNVANMGKFSSDRTILEYTREIWGVKPVHIELNR